MNKKEISQLFEKERVNRYKSLTNNKKEFNSIEYNDLDIKILSLKEEIKILKNKLFELKIGVIRDIDSITTLIKG